MPSPPPCKKTDHKAFISEAKELVDYAEKEVRGSEPSGGWSVLINFPDGTVLSFGGNSVKIGTDYYSLSDPNGFWKKFFGFIQPYSRCGGSLFIKPQKPIQP